MNYGAIFSRLVVDLLLLILLRSSLACVCVPVAPLASVRACVTCLPSPQRRGRDRRRPWPPALCCYGATGLETDDLPSAAPAYIARSVTALRPRSLYGETIPRRHPLLPPACTPLPLGFRRVRTCALCSGECLMATYACTLQAGTLFSVTAAHCRRSMVVGARWILILHCE